MHIYNTKSCCLLCYGGWCALLPCLQVRFNDQVKFESVKTEGQFLHCSARPCGAVGFHVLENRSVMSFLSFSNDHFLFVHPVLTLFRKSHLSLLTPFPSCPHSLLPYLLTISPLLLVPHSIELNLSATESALTIIPHYRPLTSHDLKTFKVCFLCLHCLCVLVPVIFSFLSMSPYQDTCLIPWPYNVGLHSTFLSVDSLPPGQPVCAALSQRV